MLIFRFQNRNPTLASGVFVTVLLMFIILFISHGFSNWHLDALCSWRVFCGSHAFLGTEDLLYPALDFIQGSDRILLPRQQEPLDLCGREGRLWELNSKTRCYGVEGQGPKNVFE